MAKLLTFSLFLILSGVLQILVEPSVNLARNKPASQSSGPGATNCVDGNRNQVWALGSCCHTATGALIRSAWWQVDLEEPAEISRIDIYYRNGIAQRFNGYTIRIIKSLDPLDSVLCYEDPIDVLPSLTVSHNCPYTGMYVNMSVERLPGVSYPSYDGQGAIINHCELEVYGCPVGYYGSDNCNTKCATGCDEGRCNPDNGTCTCINGGTEKTCTQGVCQSRYYGPQCTPCPNGCLSDTCSASDGHCADGCQSGFYGTHCNKTCPDTCALQSCNQETGNCDGGCVTGYHGTVCEFECPTECNNTKCFQYNGTCSDGCKDMFMGNTCNECINGKHGEHCNKTCPATCKGSVCYRNNGTCVNGCSHQNLTVSTCNDCKPAYHGNLCNQTCSKNCEGGCRQIDGKCEGCIAGYYGEYCNKSCPCSQKGCQQNDGICFESAPITSPSIAGPAAGAAVGVIVLIVIIAFVIILVSRRRSRTRKDETSRMEPEMSEKTHRLTELNPPKHPGRTEHANASAVENHGIQNDDTDDETPMNSNELYRNSQNIYTNSVSRELPVSEVSELISRKTKMAEFDEEYNLLPTGYKFPHAVGQKQDNLIKNRYKTTFPYDHSRVILEKVHEHPNSDYINANYIDGTEETKLYIATQGPKPNTLSDFWRMVWQEEVGKIVMLTNLVENSKVKCDQYWPDYGESKDVVQMRITSESEKEYAFYTLRSLLLHNKKTNESRHIKHFHFTMWPDHGTPDPVQLMLFHRKVKDTETPLTGPCVVHCAAGIGRTGTFIALDSLHKYGERTGKIDIFEYVRRMRDCRMNMIQTLEQYIVLHEALLESFQYVGRAMKKEEFFESCNEFQNGKPKNQTRIYKEYQNLTSLRPVYGVEYYKGAMSKDNKGKSQNQSLLAVDKYRPYLTSHHSSRTDFINAVILSSCTKRCGYISTHYPLKDTIDDLWCMIYDHDCNTVAVLNENENTDQNVHWYPNDNNELSIQSFVITRVAGPTSYNNVERIDFNVKHKGKDDQKEVAIFILRPWPAKQCVPTSKADLLQLIDRVDNWQKGSHGPVIVICSDGTRCSGLFCAISNVIQNLQLEDEIDFFHTVRQLQIRRPQFFMTFEEYESCYQIVKAYLESANIYANT